MNEKRKVSEAERRQRQKAPLKHGMMAVDARGREALIDPSKIARLRDLKQLLRSQPGRQEVRRELAARVILICELGFEELERVEDSGESMWSTDVVRRLASYVAEARRLLAGFPKDEEVIDAHVVLRELQEVIEEYDDSDEKSKRPD